MKNKKFMVFLCSTCLVLALAALAPLAAFAKPAANPKVIELKFAHFFPPVALMAKALNAFGQEVEQRTNGRVKVTMFPGASLLPPTRIFSGVLEGAADFGFAHIDYTAGRFLVTEVTELPLGYPSAWVSTHVLNDFYRKFRPEEWNDVRVLWFSAGSPNVFLLKDKPVRKLEDLKGLAIRAPGRTGDTVKALGATPRSTPVVEVYESTAKGVLDGSMIGVEPLKGFRLADVTKYVTSSWQVGNIFCFYVVMNKGSYNKLPADIQNTIDEISKEFEERFAVAWEEAQLAGKEHSLEKGVEWIDLSPDEVARWKDAVKPVVDDYVKSMVKARHSEAEVRGWIKYIQDRIEFWTKKQAELGIKSATGPPELMK
jgi:TRAP-type C4-dicarboxylate transport system substrate-binding protein